MAAFQVILMSMAWLALWRDVFFYFFLACFCWIQWEFLSIFSAQPFGAQKINFNCVQGSPSSCHCPSIWMNFADDVLVVFQSTSVHLQFRLFLGHAEALLFHVFHQARPKVTYVFGVTFMQLSAAHLTGSNGQDSLLITYYGTLLDYEQFWMQFDCLGFQLFGSGWMWLQLFGRRFMLHLAAETMGDPRLSRTILTLFMTISGASPHHVSF